MQLSVYLKQHDFTVTQFAKMIGVSHSAVVRYNKGQRRPAKDVLGRIVDVTGGDVRANDFWPQPKAAA